MTKKSGDKVRLWLRPDKDNTGEDDGTLRGNMAARDALARLCKILEPNRLDGLRRLAQHLAKSGEWEREELVDTILELLFPDHFIGGIEERPEAAQPAAPEPETYWQSGSKLVPLSKPDRQAGEPATRGGANDAPVGTEPLMTGVGEAPAKPSRPKVRELAEQLVKDYTLCDGSLAGRCVNEIVALVDSIASDRLAAAERELKILRETMQPPVGDQHRRMLLDYLKRFGFTELGALHRAWCFDDKRPIAEADSAILDALITEGNIPAWMGDGVGCVGNLLRAQRQRAEQAERERDDLREKVRRYEHSNCGDAMKWRDEKITSLQSKLATAREQLERMREAIGELPTPEHLPQGSRTRIGVTKLKAAAAASEKGE